MISGYLSSFFPSERDARLLLPYNGSLRLHFPIFSANISHRYYDPLRPPFCLLGLLRFRSLPNTSLDFAYFCVPVRTKTISSDVLAVPVEIDLNYAQPFSFPIGCGFRFCLFTRNSRFSQVPRLPLCAHAPLEVSGGVVSACLNALMTHAFQCIQTVGFLRYQCGLSMLSLSTTNIQFSEISDAAYALTTPGFIHTLLAMHAGSLLTRLAYLVRWELSGFLLSPTG